MRILCLRKVSPARRRGRTSSSRRSFEISQLTALLAEAKSMGDVAAADRFKQGLAKQLADLRALRG